MLREITANQTGPDDQNASGYLVPNKQDRIWDSSIAMFFDYHEHSIS